MYIVLTVGINLPLLLTLTVGCAIAWRRAAAGSALARTALRLTAAALALRVFSIALWNLAFASEFMALVGLFLHAVELFVLCALAALAIRGRAGLS